jgi:hypothetical protein
VTPEQTSERKSEIFRLNLLVIDPASTRISHASESDTRTQPARCHETSDVSNRGRSITPMWVYHHLTFFNASARTEAGDASFAGSWLCAL